MRGKEEKILNKQFYDACMTSFKEYSKGSYVSFYVPKKLNSTADRFFNMIGNYFLEVLKISAKHNKKDLKEVIERFKKGTIVDFSEDGSLVIENEEGVFETYKDKANSINILNSLRQFDESKFFKFSLVRVKSSKEIIEFIESFIRSLTANFQYKKDSFDLVLLRNMKIKSVVNYPELYYDYSDYVIDIHVSPNQNKVRFNVFPTRFALDNKVIPIRNYTTFGLSGLSSLLNSGIEFERNLNDALIDALKLIFKSNYGGIAKVYNYGNLVLKAISRHKNFYIFHNETDFIGDQELEKLALDIENVYIEISNSMEDEALLKKYAYTLVEHFNNFYALRGGFSLSYWIYNLLSKASGANIKRIPDLYFPKDIEPPVVIKDPISTLSSFSHNRYIAITDKKIFNKRVVKTLSSAPATFLVGLDIEVGPSVI